MSFHPARAGLIPRLEKRLCPPPAERDSLDEIERTAMTNEELNQQAAEMWTEMRDDGRLIADAPLHKVGMPSATPYGVSFPIEIDGVLSFIELEPEQAVRLARGLLDAAPEAVLLSAKQDAAYALHVASISRNGRLNA